jgi:hypothetical protein
MISHSVNIAIAMETIICLNTENHRTEPEQRYLCNRRLWIRNDYPLVNIQKTLENHHFWWVNQLSIAIFKFAKCKRLPGRIHSFPAIFEEQMPMRPIMAPWTKECWNVPSKLYNCATWRRLSWHVHGNQPAQGSCQNPRSQEKTIKIARTWDVHHPKKIDHLKIV